MKASELPVFVRFLWRMSPQTTHVQGSRSTDTKQEEEGGLGHLEREVDIPNISSRQRRYAALCLDRLNSVFCHFPF